MRQLNTVPGVGQLLADIENDPLAGPVVAGGTDADGVARDAAEPADEHPVDQGEMAPWGPPVETPDS